MKIKLDLIEAMKNASSKELDFIFYILQFQNSNGSVKGIYYNDVINALKINKSTFFAIKDSLVEKNIISVDYNENNYGLWEFTILNNDFSDKNYSTGYINTNIDFLHSEKFMNLNKSTKLVILKFLSLHRPNKEYLTFNLRNIIKWLNCTRQTAYEVIKTLTEIFDINCFIKNNALKVKKYYSIKVDKLFERSARSENDVVNAHNIIYSAKINGCYESIFENAENIRIMSDFIKQYKNSLSPFSVIKIGIDTIIEKAELIPKYINSIIQKNLNNDNLIKTMPVNLKNCQQNRIIFEAEKIVERINTMPNFRQNKKNNTKKVKINNAKLETFSDKIEDLKNIFRTELNFEISDKDIKDIVVMADYDFEKISNRIKSAKNQLIQAAACFSEKKKIRNMAAWFKKAVKSPDSDYIIYPDNNWLSIDFDYSAILKDMLESGKFEFNGDMRDNRDLIEETAEKILDRSNVMFNKLLTAIRISVMNFFDSQNQPIFKF